MIFTMKILVVAFYSICIAYTNYKICNHVADWFLKVHMNNKVRILLLILLIIGSSIVTCGSPFLLTIMMFGGIACVD